MQAHRAQYAAGVGQGARTAAEGAAFRPARGIPVDVDDAADAPDGAERGAQLREEDRVDQHRDVDQADALKRVLVRPLRTVERGRVGVLVGRVQERVLDIVLLARLYHGNRAVCATEMEGDGANADVLRASGRGLQKLTKTLAPTTPTA